MTHGIITPQPTAEELRKQAIARTVAAVIDTHQALRHPEAAVTTEHPSLTPFRTLRRCSEQSLDDVLTGWWHRSTPNQPT